MATMSSLQKKKREILILKSKHSYQNNPIIISLDLKNRKLGSKVTGVQLTEDLETELQNIGSK